MKEQTSYRNIGGTFYIRIPPAFCKHGLGLTEKERETAGKVKITIETKEGSGRVTLEVEK